ncbi:hypothetical protein LTR93_006693 [Exophiala xenobiotica]|nr:hypothetical protein LTR93_006693 [Exophiala xenobiotica]
MLSPPWWLLGAALALFVSQQLIVGIIWNRKYKLPPRVPGIPFFGNTFQIPASQQGSWAKALAEKFGEMFTCKLGSQTWVFLNSSRVVKDLMERRSAIYSSRPEWPMTQDILSGGSRIVMMGYTDRWRKLRKIMHSILNSGQTEVYKPFQDIESRHLLWDYLHNPGKWYTANGRFANSVIMSVVFGRRSQLDDPATAKLFETVEDFLFNAQPGANLVDAYPILSKLPTFLQWWRPRGHRLFHKTLKVYQDEVKTIQQKMAAGKQKDCFATYFLQQYEKEPDIDETQRLFVLRSLLEAGSDTSKVSVGQIIAAVYTFPDWIPKARVELDAVLPNFGDREKLPYITAVVKEGFRWRPNIAEIGAPTVLIKDDEYEGYKFPAATVFTWNAWAISLSPEEYDDPERFYPERFLNDDLNNPLKGHFAFGPGRRVCTGWHVGESNVWIAISRLLYCFDFEEVPGQPIDTMTIPQLSGGKPPFAVNIKVRSEKHAQLIERECSSIVDIQY